MASLLQSTTIGGHAAIHAGNIGSQSVNYANSAGSVAWTNVSGRPTLLSQFTNDLGNYGGWITSAALANYLTTSQVTTSMISGLNNMLGVTTLPYSVDITVGGDPDKFYAVQFWGGDQDVWRRIIIKRGYSEPAPWDPIGTGVHHGGLLLDWEGNFGGWGGAEYADRLRVFNESYTNVCADMFIWSHSMGYVFMLRGGGALYHLHSDQAINGYYQAGSPDILYSTSTLSYDDTWSGTNVYDVPAPAPLSLSQVNSTRIDGLRTKKQSLLDNRYLRQGIDISGIGTITTTNSYATNFFASNAFYLNGASYFLNSTNGGIYTNARFESATLIVAPGGNSTNWNTAYGWGNHATAGYASASSLANYLPLAGGTMTGNITITSADIRSNAASGWTGDPGTQGKIQYHSNRWYIVADQDSNRIVQFRRNGTDVSYIDNNGVYQGNISGNADTVDGFHASVGASANSIPTRNASGYLIPESWIQLNGIYGLYSPTNNAHLRPNDGTYGSWLVTGSRNSWRGLEFDSGSAGNVTMMVSVDSNTVGFHNNSYGWQIRWANGTLHVGKNSYGGGDVVVLDASNFTSYAASASHTHDDRYYTETESDARYIYYRGYSTGGDFQTLQSTERTLRFDQVGVVDSWSNAPSGVYTYGGVLSLRGESFSLQIYGSHTGDLTFKTQWDNDQHSGWRNIIHSSNIGSQSVNYANSAGSANSVAWTNVSGRPTALSQFTNDITISYTETDTLQSVTNRGASTSAQVSFTKTDDHAISVGTIRGRAVGSQTGEFIHLYERVHIGSPSGWGAANTAAPSHGLSVYGGANIGYGNSASLFAYAYRGNSNVAGTGEASYHPAGIYSTGTNWLYGTMYVNNNHINDVGYLGVGQSVNTNYRIITNGDYYANGGGNFWAEGRFKQYRGSGTWHDVIDSGNIGSQSVATATRTSGNSGYGHAGTGMWPFFNWGGSNGGGSAPNDGSYTTGISVGSHPNDQAYGFQIANNMWNTGLWTRNYNSGFGSWIRIIDSDIIGSQSVAYATNSGNSATTSQRQFDYIYTTSYLESAGAVYGTIFYDNNDRTYYVDPNGTSNLNFLNLGNGREEFPFLRMGAAGRYAIGVSGAHTRISSHNQGSGVQLGSYDGTTFTPKLTVSNDGNVTAESSLRAPIFYDSNDTAYYLNPAGGSRLRNLYVGDSGDDWSDPGGWGTQVRFSNAPHVRFVLHARTPGIEAGMYVHTPGEVYIGSYTGHNVSMMWGGSRKMFITNSYVYTDVYLEAAGSMRAPIFYDSADTGFYLDPNDTSNLWRFTDATLNRHSLNSKQVNSPWSTRASQGALYQTGAMGWGQVDLNVIGSNWGSGFFDTWSSPANGPGASGHYVGMQAFHYSNSDSSRFHGWQMACAQEANNRWFWRSAWDSPRAWVEMIHSGNIGSQSVNYASSAGNADTVDGYHASTSTIANGIVVRDGNGYIFGNYINTTDDVVGGSVTGVIVKQGDNYHRTGNQAAIRSFLGLGSLAYSSDTIPTNNNQLSNGAGYVTSSGSVSYASESYIVRSTNDFRHANRAPSDWHGLANSWHFNDSGTLGVGGDYWQSVLTVVPWYGYADSHRQQQLTFAGSAGLYFRFATSGTTWSDWSRIYSDLYRPYADSAGNADTVDGYHMNQNVLTTSSPTFQEVYANGWFRTTSHQGIYNPTNGAHFYPNDNSYGAWKITGSRNGWGGINLQDPSGFNHYYMHESGNGGLLSHDRWVWYHHRGNNSLGLGESTTSSSYKVYVTGSLYATGDIVAYSDRRKKTDIVTIEDALEKVKSMRGVFYTKIDESEKGRQVGVIAQEMHEVLPEAVTYASDVDEYGVKYGNIVGVLIEAIKEQQKEIDELKAKLN